MTMPYFSNPTFTFLAQLASNNERLWFEAHKQEYEDFVRGPALDFIADMAEQMPSISRHFRAVPKKVGGSLLRIQRNLRFSRDKTPYKTNIGMHFRHELCGDIHAPGYYVHIEPRECFVAVGLWRPEADVLFKVREAILGRGDAWVAVRDDKTFRRHFRLEGDTLINAPRDYAKDHPLLEDLKRKDFIAMAPLTEKEVLSANFCPLVAERFRQAGPFMRFLCEAIGVPF